MTIKTLVRCRPLRIAASALISILSLQAQTYRFSCPAYGGGYLPVSWQPRYNAYIAADHIFGATDCVSSLYGGKTKIYRGDGNADIGDGWPIQSARIYEAINFQGSLNNGPLNFPASRTTLWSQTGQTRNYGWFSPVNGSTLSEQDEDNLSEDCVKWHQAGYGDTTDMHVDLTTSGSTQQNGSVRFYGTGSNPLESSIARIAWDMRVNMNGDNPTDARVTNINYYHTRFPSHVIKAQGFTTYYWGPPRSDITYVFGCLVLQQGKIIGESSPNKKVPCG